MAQGKAWNCPEVSQTVCGHAGFMLVPSPSRSCLRHCLLQERRRRAGGRACALLALASARSARIFEGG
eukprot:1982347-Alexandrium_andersonii.AAC.1